MDIYDRQLTDDDGFIWVGDGNHATSACSGVHGTFTSGESTIKVFDQSGNLVADIGNGGNRRVDELAFGKVHSSARLPAVIGGSSSGCRTSLAFALQYPSAVRALLLWRVTGGQFAAQRLANQYYTVYTQAAQHGGMAAVCETKHFGERLAANPSNRDRLHAWTPGRRRCARVNCK